MKLSLPLYIRYVLFQPPAPNKENVKTYFRDTHTERERERGGIVRVRIKDEPLESDFRKIEGIVVVKWFEFNSRTMKKAFQIIKLFIRKLAESY